MKVTMVTKQSSWASDGSFPVTSLSVTAPAPGWQLARLALRAQATRRAAEEPVAYLCLCTVGKAASFHP